jgi:NADH-quinone oxidoreductase subunit C
VLCNFESGDEMLLKTSLAKGDDAMSVIEIDSVCSVWDAADFQERECYDMMGISFKNHPDMRRILCPDDWEGFPLRKDYVAQEQWHGMTVYPEAKSNKVQREFSAKLKEEEKAKLAAEKEKLAAAQAVAKQAETDDNKAE